MRKVIVGLAIAAAMLAPSAAIAQDAGAPKWGCYDPQPKHPTAKEAEAFVERVAPLAIAAERKYGVPATAIAAMTTVEGGFGWTHTAQDAQNFFGWKYTSAEAAGGRASYTLTCQPKSDPGNQYVVFKNLADSVDFVASRLAASDYYLADRETYLAARRAGKPSSDAVNAWIAGISDPYNQFPKVYTKAIETAAKRKFTGGKFKERTLYALSQDICHAPSDAAFDASAHARECYDSAIKTGGRYMEKGCGDPILDFAGYAGLPVKRCAYEQIKVHGIAYLLDPDASQLARWTVTACQDAAVQETWACLDATYLRIWGASNAQFVVRGFAIEDGNGVGSSAHPNDAFCPMFRDGVTVRTPSLPGLDVVPAGRTCGADESFLPPNATPQQRKAAEDAVVKQAEVRIAEAPSSAKAFARVASTSRPEYVAAHPGVDVADLKWVDVAGDAYRRAWGADRNDLISASVLADKRAGKFH